MRLFRGYGYGQAIVFRCRFFTLIIHFHKLKDWRRINAKNNRY